jgi:hypothetical protein
LNETETETKSDKELNFEKLRAQNEAQEQELAELRPLRIDKSIRDAGFDPTTDKGKALSIALKAGEVETDPGRILEYAEAEFGWKPEKPLSSTEAATVTAAAQSHQIQTQSSSDEPEDVDGQIVQAENDGDWNRAVGLKLGKLYNTG